MKASRVITCSIVLCLTGWSVTLRAQAPLTPSQVSAQSQYSLPKVVYVGEFTPITPSASDEGGLFARKRAQHDAKKIDANAAALADAVVAALRTRGVNSLRLPPGEERPQSGWLLEGSYHQTISHSSLSAIAGLVGDEKPNTDTVISIRDLSSGANGTLSTFTSTTTLRGQGTSFSTNPYILVARVVIHRAEATSSMADLAGGVADRVIAIARGPAITRSSANITEPGRMP
jgi:hypothetical protein